MTSRPDKFPRWATNDVVDATTGQNNVVEPPESRKDNGWAFQEKPPRNWVNWLWRTTHSWLNFLDERTDALGVRPASPASMQVSVAAGFIDLVGGKRRSVAATNLTVTAPGADSKHVLVTVNMVTGALALVDGVAAATPVDPSIPASTRRLARVRVTAGQTTITAASIDDLRTYFYDPRFIGEMMEYGSTSAPEGWLLCDGSAVSRTTYADLFAVIGTSWGAGDGSTTFNLPNRAGRAAIGTGTGSGLTARTIGQTGGAETHTLTQTETPLKSHAHGVSDPTHSHAFYRADDGGQAGNTGSYPGSSDGTLVSVGTTAVSTGITVNTASDATAAAHNNMQPWIAVPVFIRAL